MLTLSAGDKARLARRAVVLEQAFHEMQVGRTMTQFAREFRLYSWCLDAEGSNDVNARAAAAALAVDSEVSAVAARPGTWFLIPAKA